MVQIALCEDKPQELAHMRRLLAQYAAGHPQVRVRLETYENAKRLMAAIGQGMVFHIFLLDIFMPGTDGVELARQLRAAGNTGVIIFLTSTREFAYEAFGVRALDYVLKPMRSERLNQVLDNALDYLDNRKNALYTLVQMADADRMVALDDIIAVEVQGHTLRYYLASGEVLGSKVLRIPFGQAAVDLIGNERFIRPHQSYLVNADHVMNVSKKKLQMDNGMEVPVSRQRFADMKSRYIAYLTKRGEPV